VYNAAGGPNDEAMQIFHLWMDEIGGLVVYLDKQIADLTEQRVDLLDDPTDSQRLYIEGMIDAYEDIRDML
jgi:hypothetical protein